MPSRSRVLAAAHFPPRSCTVVTGVGFASAGFIVRQSNNDVVGMTNAGVVWLCAAIGLAVGFEYYIAATVTTVICIVLLNVPKILRAMCGLDLRGENARAASEASIRDPLINDDR